LDKIAALWTITATNTDPGSHPLTGKHVEVMGMSIIHFENGKIKDEWIASNDGYWLQQLGFKLAPPTPEQ
jgi:predicted ester cyclase